MLIGQQNGLVSHIIEHRAAHGARLNVFDNLGSDFAAALKHAENDGLACRSHCTLGALILVLIRFFAAEHRFIEFNGSR